MALKDHIQDLLDDAEKAGKKPVPDQYQGINKERIAAVLTELSVATPDSVDAVYALLDNEHDNWFSTAPTGSKFCDGASIAHLGYHIGFLQRGTRTKLDREGRDYWIKPLSALGAILLTQLHSKHGGFLPGHPISKSPNSAYRLADDFKTILQEPEERWKDSLRKWSQKEHARERAALQAKLEKESLARVDTKHRDLIEASVKHYAPLFLKEYRVLYTDLEDGDRVSDEEAVKLAEAGITLTNRDAMPDVLLWNSKSNSLWVIEAVTSDGEVDSHKVAQINELANRSGIANIGFTTTYRNWKEAAARQSKYKNIAPETYIWILEDPSKQYLAKTFRSTFAE